MKKIDRHVHTYAVYDKDDNLQMVGNSHECAVFLGITLASFYCRVNRLKTGELTGDSRGVIIVIKE